MRRSKLELLKDPEVHREIDRYKWIESIKAGYDISLERAMAEWLAFYAEAWRKVHRTRRRSVSVRFSCQ